MWAYIITFFAQTQVQVSLAFLKLTSAKYLRSYLLSLTPKKGEENFHFYAMVVTSLFMLFQLMNAFTGALYSQREGKTCRF